MPRSNPSASLPVPAPLQPPRKKPRHCPKCKYDTTHTRGNICPECGPEFARPSTAYWCGAPFFIGAAGLVTALVPAAYAALVILSAANFSTANADRADHFNIVILIAWFATLVKLGISWINWSSVMAAWPRPKHWLTAAACWLLPLAGIGIAYLMRTWP